MKTKLFVVASLVISFSAHASSAKIPKGWRLPTPKELSGEWRDKHPAKFAALSGDFDGDGKADEVKILMKAKGEKFGVFAWLSGNKAKKGPFNLAQNELPSLPTMGISLATKGEVLKTACGKGYWDCAKGEPAELKLESDAVNYFKEESANSLFTWNSASKAFDRTWMSD